MTCFEIASARKSVSESLRAGLRFGAGLLAVPMVILLGTSAQAQDAGLALWNGGGCFGCHGDLAAGGGDPANPGGPSLRRRIAPEVVLKTIACGRPNTDMPSFLIDADKSPICARPATEPAPGAVATLDLFTAEEVQTLVAWLEANVIGKSRITRENCAAFFDGNANTPTCLQY